MKKFKVDLGYLIITEDNESYILVSIGSEDILFIKCSENTFVFKYLNELSIFLKIEISDINGSPIKKVYSQKDFKIEVVLKGVE